MFSFNPFNKISSFLFSKFLTPYFSAIDESQINIGFWKGEITLKNLEISKNFFFLNNIDIEVLYGTIDELSIKIPWKSISTQPIELYISGLNLVLSNVMQRSKKQKKEIKDQLNTLKKEALIQFEQNIQNKQSNESSFVYLTNLFKNFIENATIKLEKIDIVFIYQIHDYELVKFGLSIYSFVIKKPQKMERDEETLGILRKDINISKISLFFEFYDSFFVKNSKEASFNNENETEAKKNKNYIINSFDLNIALKLDYLFSFSTEISIVTTPILIFLKQRQIRHLLRAVSSILNQRSDRPLIKPGIADGSKQWWKYLFKRIIKEENIELKVKNRDWYNCIKAERYKHLYIKSKLSPQKTTIKEKAFIEIFEETSSLVEILSLRNFAINTISIMKCKLVDEQESNQMQAKTFFANYQVDNTQDFISEIGFPQRQASEDRSFTFKAKISITRIDVLIQENELLMSLKKLHNYVSTFKEVLNEKSDLKNKILDHIRNNFVEELNAKQKEMKKSEEEPKNRNGTKRRTSIYNWNQDLGLEYLLDKIKQNKKLLLHMWVEKIQIDLEKTEDDIENINILFGKIEAYDAHKLNYRYKKILNVSNGFKILIKKSIVKPKGGEQIEKIDFDFMIPNVEFILPKPFIERLYSMIQMIFFDATKFADDKYKQDKYEKDHHITFFNKILLIQRKNKQEINISVSLENLSFYFPINYNIYDKMLLLQIKDIRLFKREDMQQKSDLLNNHHRSLPKGLQFEDFHPVFMNLACFKLLFVSEFDWELRENIFFQNLKKINKEIISDQTHVNKNCSKVLMETLPIHFRMEFFKKTYILEAEGNEFQKSPWSKSINPISSRYYVDLPLIKMDLSINNLMMLKELISTWLITGPNLYSAVMNVTVAEEEKEIKNPSKSSNRFKKNCYISPKIDYSSNNIISVLESFEISNFKINVEGFLCNLYLDNQNEQKKNKDKIHNNKIISFYIEACKISMVQKYFSTQFEIQILQTFIHNHNCLNWDVASFIKDKINRRNTKLENQIRNSAKEKSSARKTLNEENLTPAEKDSLFNKLDQELDQISKIGNENLFADDPGPDSFLKEEPSREDNELCEFCFHELHSKRRLLLNSFFKKESKPDGHESNEDPHIKIYIIFFNKEYENVCKKKLTYTNIEIELSANFVFVIDPLINKNLRNIMTLVDQYSNERVAKFKSFMRNNGFWPDFDSFSPVSKSSSNTPSFKPKNSDFSCSITISSLSLLCYYNHDPIYLLNLEKIAINIYDFKIYTLVKLLSKNPTLHDISKNRGNHAELIKAKTDYKNYGYDRNQNSNIEEEGNFGSLDCEIKIFDKNFAAINKFSTYVGLRLGGVRVVFLKRIVNELVEYVRFHALKSFFGEEGEVGEVEAAENSALKLEILIIDSQVAAYQNSILKDALILEFSKLGIWSTGAWGEEYGNLIKTCGFSYELENEDEQRKTAGENNGHQMEFEDDVVFYDARSDIDTEEDQNANTIQQSADSEECFNVYDDKENSRTNEKPLEYYRIHGENFRATNGNNPNENLILATSENSLDIDIFLEDQKFEDNSSCPIKITINFTNIKLYLYDPDFKLIIDLIQENLAEIPQTVVSPPVPSTSTKCWLYVDIFVEKLLLKLFKGKRSDLYEFLQKNGNFNPDSFLYKNPNSLALGELRAIMFKMYMYENGGQKMTLQTQKFDLSDFRLKSKLLHYQKKIFFNLKPKQFKGEELTLTSAQENLSPKENNADLNIGFDLNDKIKEDEEMAINISFDEENAKEKFKQDEIFLDSIFSNNGIKNSNSDNMNKANNVSDHQKPRANISTDKKMIELQIPTQKNKSNEKLEPSLNQEMAVEQLNLLEEQRKDKEINIEEHNKNNNVIIIEEIPIQNKKEEKDNKKLSNGTSFQKFWKKCFAMFKCCKRKKTIKIIENKNVEVYKPTERKHLLEKNEFEENGGEFKKLLESRKQEFHESGENLINHNFNEIKPIQLQSTENMKSCEGGFGLVFTSSPEGEKLIDISIEQKNLIIFIDLIQEMIAYFMKPFGEEKNYIETPIDYNNYPPMTVRINLTNIFLILLSEYFNPKKESSSPPSESIAILTDIKYEHVWKGDAYNGPGQVLIDLEAKLNKFCIFQTKDLLNDHFFENNDVCNFPFTNILDAFSLKLQTNYRIAFYKKDSLTERKLFCDNGVDIKNAFYELILFLGGANSGRWEIAIPIRKIRYITNVIRLISEPSILPSDSPKSPLSDPRKNLDPFLPTCINRYNVSMDNLTLRLLKNANEIQYGKVEFQQVKCYMLQKGNNSQLKTKCTFNVDYFNKRKMDFEPLIEPWTFNLIQTNINSDQMIILKNQENIDEKQPKFLQENKNSLNINITTSGIETILEAYKFYENPSIDEKEPCILYNKLGLVLKYRNAKETTGTRKHYFLKPHKKLDILKQFRRKKSPNKTTKHQQNSRTAINVVILKKDHMGYNGDNVDEGGEEEKEEVPPIKPIPILTKSNTTNLNLTYNLSQFANQSNSPQNALLIPNNSTLFIKERKAKKVSHKEDFKKYSVYESYDQSSSNFNSSSIFAYSNNALGNNNPSAISNLGSNLYLTKEANNSRDLEVIPENSNPKTFHAKVMDEKDHKISDYRVVKDVYLDQIGNTIYKLERINRIEQERQKKNNKIFGIDLNFNINFANLDSPLEFLSSNRKMNEEGNTYLIADVRFAPKKGYKEIYLKSSVKFLSKVDSDVEVRFFWKYKKTSLKKVILKAGHEYNIPIKFIETPTQVTFRRMEEHEVPNIRSSARKKNNEGSEVDLVYSDSNTSAEDSDKEMELPSDPHFYDTRKSILKSPHTIQEDSPKRSDRISNLEYEKYDLDKFICDKLALGEFEQDSEHFLSGKEHGKENILVAKQDFVISSILHHGKASYGHFYFIISCVKQKIATNQRSNKKRDETCYETTLVLLPIFKIRNLTPEILAVGYNTYSHSKKKTLETTEDISQKKLFPKYSYNCLDVSHNEDLAFNISLRSNKEGDDFDQRSNDIRIYIKNEKKFSFPISIKNRNKSKAQQKLFLWCEVKKMSQKSRDIVIFCPYLIVDETNKLKFKEADSILTTKTFSKILEIGKKMRLTRTKTGLDSKMGVSVREFKENAQSDQFWNSCMDAAGIVDPEERNSLKKELEVLKKIEMFSTSKKMNGIKVALKDSPKHIWSKGFPLQNIEEILSLIEAPIEEYSQQNHLDAAINVFSKLSETFKTKRTKHNVRKKYQFGVKIIPAPDIFYRSKLILFTPKYMIKNECDNLIAIAQYETEHAEENIIRIRKDQWQEFHWTDHKRKDCLVMSLCNRVTGNVIGWSGRFKIDKVQDLAIKLNKFKNKIQDNEYFFARISINLYDNIYCVRIMNEDKLNPPYMLRNSTNHEISFRHKVKLSSKRNIDEVPFTILYPGEDCRFTWEQWDDENDRILQIEIDGQLKDYPIEKIQECEPFILNANNEKKMNNQIKTHLYKKGKLTMKKFEKQGLDEVFFAVLSVGGQKLKLYDEKTNSKKKIILRQAKIDSYNENEFVLKVGNIKQPYIFQAEEGQCQDWVNFIWKSILLENPEIIFVKVEPFNLTKIIQFQSEGGNIFPISEEMESIEKTKPKKFTFKVQISNAIGISIIDSLPREIIQITLKKCFFQHETIESIKENKGRILNDSIETKEQKQTISFSIDSLILNNQLDNTQFPVFLAPNKKKLTEGQSFLKGMMQSKSTSLVSVPDSKEQAAPQISSLTYLEQMNIILDSIEIRLEDGLIEALCGFYSEISPSLSVVEVKKDQKSILNDPRTLENKLEEKIKLQYNYNKTMVYIKNFLLDQIDICFTFRDNPGEKNKSILNSWGSYFGISFASIDSAKIKLAILNNVHWFGCWSDFSNMIFKHYHKCLLSQLKKLFLAMDILGNPYSLGENVFSGLSSMVVVPLAELRKLKFERFGKSLASGSYGFLVSTISSVFVSVNKIIGTLMKTLAKMTLDRKYLYDRQIMKNRAIKDIKEGIVIGLKNFGWIVYDTCSGVIRLPVKAIKANGCLMGIFRGTYEAVASIFIKPLVAFYDLLNSLIEGIINSNKYEGHIMEIRSRPPRIFSQERLVIPFDYIPAMTSLLISKYKLREIDGEIIKFFDEIKNQSRFLFKKKIINYQVILTDFRFLFADKMSAIDCVKISLHKIDEVKYNAEKRKFYIRLLIPIKKKLASCNMWTTNLVRIPFHNPAKAEILLNALKSLKVKTKTSDN